MKFELGEILQIVAFFQLSILIIILLQKGGIRLPNRLLAFFFFAQLIISFSGLWNKNTEFLIQNYPYLQYLAKPFSYIWGPTMYFFVLAQLKDGFKLKLKHVIHYLPAIVLAGYLIFAFHIKPVEVKRQIIHSGLFDYNEFLIMAIAMLGQVFIYNIISTVLIRKYAGLKKNMSNLEWSVFSRTQFILYGYFFACTVYDVIFILFFILKGNQHLHKYFLLSEFVFTLYYLLASFKLIAWQDNILTGKSDKKQRNLIVSQEQIVDIIERLEDHMRKNKPYLEFNYSLDQLADELSVKPRELSQAINEVKNQNFYDFINQYRIIEAQQLLKDSIETNKTILEIVYESGFNSKTAFNVAFKKSTGKTPTQFKKQ